MIEKNPLLTNIFPNVKSPTVELISDIPTVLEHIRQGTYKEKVLESRTYGKGHPIFEENKTTTPTFTPNGTFNKRRSVGTIDTLTGFIYVDIDNEIDIKQFHELPFIYSYWKSFSGHGYGVLVSVSGLNKENFKLSWNYLNNLFEQIGIHIDLHTKDISRQCVISFDPEIYINPKVIPLIIPDKTLKELFETTTTLPTYTSNITYTEKIKYQTTLDDYGNMDYKVIEQGKEYRTTYFPQIIQNGKRHKWLSSITNSILFNNPSITCEKLEMILYKINYEHCNPKLPREQVKKITDWSFNKHINHELSITTKKKKIWINPDKQLTTKQKKSIIGIVSGKLRRKQTITKLIESYKQLLTRYPKVTQKLLEQNSTYKLRTIKKYWKEILDGVLYNNIYITNILFDLMMTCQQN